MSRDSRGDFLALSFQPADIRHGRTTALGSSSGFRSLLIEEFALQLGIASNAGQHTELLFDSLLSCAPLGSRSLGFAESCRAFVFQLAPFLLQVRTVIGDHAHVALGSLNILLQSSRRHLERQQLTFFTG